MSLQHFIVQLTQLKLANAKKSKEAPALAFYHSQARAILFRLEGLSKLHKKFANKSFFKALQSEFKIVEDQLGKIDYYDSFLREFKARKNIPVSFLKYFQDHVEHELNQLTLLLKDIPMNTTAYMDTLQKRLEDIPWLNDVAKDRTGIGNAVLFYIDEVMEEYKTGILQFNDVEEGLHKFRRELRWISIYASSVNGLFQLIKSKHIYPPLFPYLTEEIIHLPYNVMPPAIKGINPITIESQNFYALSWIIQEFGKLKDMGLKWNIINNALKENKVIKNTADLKKQLQGELEYNPTEILSLAQNMADDFLFKNGVLSRIKRDINRSLNS